MQINCRQQCLCGIGQDMCHAQGYARDAAARGCICNLARDENKVRIAVSSGFRKVIQQMQDLQGVQGAAQPCIVWLDTASCVRAVRRRLTVQANNSNHSELFKLVLNPQVDGYLRKLNVVKEAVDDTAGAAQTVAKKQLKGEERLHKAA